jgi:RNA polymerase sigma-70 factor (ECF subfamily)
MAAKVEAGSGRVRAGPVFEDAGLLERCRRGDTAAFGSLVVKYQDRVFNAILRACGNHDDAEELCQETFVKALENLDGFRQASGFYTWVFRIAMNLTISRRRRSGRMRFHSLEAVGSDNESGRPRNVLPDHRQAGPHEAASRADEGQRVLKALEELDEEFRVAVVLRDVEGMNYDQIAQVLEVPVGTVKSRLYRARSVLQRKLRDLIS